MTSSKEHQERRGQLLDAAESLFMEKGYTATTVNDIIAREGVAKGTFYHYFRSKEEVLTSLVDRFWDQFEAEARGIIDDPSSTTMTKVKSVLGNTIALKKRKMYLIPIVHQEQNVLLLDKLRREGQARFTPLVTRLVEHGVQEGVFDTPYPRQAAEFLMRSLGDPVLAADHDQGRREAETWLEALGDILERVLGASRGSFRDLIRDVDLQIKDCITTAHRPTKEMIP